MHAIVTVNPSQPRFNRVKSNMAAILTFGYFVRNELEIKDNLILSH